MKVEQNKHNTENVINKFFKPNSELNDGKENKYVTFGKGVD